MKFEYTPDGYQKAKEYLIAHGDWDRVTTSGLSTDGYSIVHEANAIYEKLTGQELEVNK